MAQIETTKNYLKDLKTTIRNLQSLTESEYSEMKEYLLELTKYPVMTISVLSGVCLDVLEKKKLEMRKLNFSDYKKILLKYYTKKEYSQISQEIPFQSVKSWTVKEFNDALFIDNINFDY